MTRTESPHDCPYCGSEDGLYSRPVGECGFIDVIVATRDYEYKCRSCGWSGYGPGPAANGEEANISRLDRAFFRAQKAVTEVLRR